MFIYPLQILLSSLADSSGKKRLLFTMGPLGGIDSRLIMVFFILLPILEYGLFFNPYVFKILGIATAIVAYIVCLSLVMIMVFFIAWRTNSKVIQTITPSWNHYFAKRDLELVVSSRISPYSQFFDYYAQSLGEKIPSEELHLFLLNAFVEMEKKNKDLLDAINRNTDLSH